MKNIYKTFRLPILIYLLTAFINPSFGQTYCPSTWSNLSDDWISNVTFGSINNSSGSTSYTDYTATQSTIVTAGVTYPISVTVDIANGTWLQHAAVWIDWNQDFVFDATEFTYLGDNQSTAPSFTINNNVTVPVTALPGSTRMRVIERYDIPLIGTDACASGIYGETEDYTVIVASSGPNDAGVVSIDSPYAVCPGNLPVVATVKNYGSNQITTVNVNWMVNGALQTPYAYSGLIDTLGGSPNEVQMAIGTFNFLSNTTYTIEAWTSSPNGATDSTAINDSSSWTFSDIILPPNNLVASNVTSSAADLGWTEAGNAMQWEIEYGLQGFAQGSGNTMVSNSNPANVSGLNPNSWYEYYVRSICGPGDTSVWSTAGIFLTACVMEVAPYFESFDGPTWGSGTIFSNTDDTLDQCWDRSGTVNDYSFRVSTTNNLINHSTGTAPDADYSGSGNFVYAEASLGVTGDTAFLESPWIDLAGTTAPVLSFWTHLYGVDIGAVGAQMTNDGVVWSTVWSNFGSVQTSSNDPWTERVIPVSQYSGDTVKFRFYAISLGCCSGDPSFDQIRLRQPPPIDLAVLELDSPNSDCGAGIENVTMTIANLGADTVFSGTAISMEYNINGGSNIVEVYNPAIDILPGDTFMYTFTTMADLTTPNTYDFIARAILSGDGDPLNDTIFKRVLSIPVINTFPYSEGFEMGNGGWTAGGDLNTWALGTPNKAVINSAATGTQAWVTGGLGPGPYNNAEASFVVGPCFDFTNIVRPEFDLNIWWDSENTYDGAQLQASTDGGMTWNRIGSFGNPNNWYNYTPITGLTNAGHTGDGWTGGAGGGSNGWITASSIDQNLGGESDVFIRVFFGSDISVNTGYDGVAFDDFGIVEDALADDMQLDSIQQIQSSCGLSATTPIRIVLRNYGLNTQTNIPVTYYIGGVAQSTEIVPGPLGGGQVTLYTFIQTADLSAPGNYLITASVDLVNDMDSTNDTYGPMAVTSYQVPMITSFQGSEQCVPGATSISATSDIGVVRWYDAASGGTLLNTGNTLSIPNLTSTVVYYAEPFNNSTIPCVGPRQAVVAELSSVPQVDFVSQQISSLTIQFTSTLSNNVDSVWWDYGDFGAGSDDPNPTHTYSTPGTKVVTLNAFDGSCDTSIQKAIFVLGVENGLANHVDIYPNPTSGEFQFTAEGLGESLKIQIVDQKGNVVLDENWEGDGTYRRMVTLPKGLAAGIYFLRVIDGDRVGRIKIVKE